jgi:hypothetical protein
VGGFYIRLLACRSSFQNFLMDGADDKRVFQYQGVKDKHESVFAMTKLISAFYNKEKRGGG